jgi:hypothetical protein
VQYGRSEDEWVKLASVGKEFLIERARMGRTTSYTEFNAALVNRTGAKSFDFDLDSDRAAVGALLGQISEDAAEEIGGLLISALVQYLDTNDAGPGFYALARSKGFVVPASSDDRQLFWAGHVGHVHKYYSRR